MRPRQARAGALLDALLVLPRAGEDGNYINYHRSFGTTTTGGNGALCEIGLTLELRVGGGQIDAARKEQLASLFE